MHKTIVKYVFYWFLLQLIIVSAASSANGWEQSQGTFICDEGNTSKFGATIAGLILPITQFSFISAEFCWNDTSVNQYYDETN